jgi:hypothetical protein
MIRAGMTFPFAILSGSVMLSCGLRAENVLQIATLATLADRKQTCWHSQANREVFGEA